MLGCSNDDKLIGQHQNIYSSKKMPKYCTRIERIHELHVPYAGEELLPIFPTGEVIALHVSIA